MCFTENDTLPMAMMIDKRWCTQIRFLSFCKACLLHVCENSSEKSHSLFEHRPRTCLGVSYRIFLMWCNQRAMNMMVRIYKRLMNECCGIMTFNRDEWDLKRLVGCATEAVAQRPLQPARVSLFLVESFSWQAVQLVQRPNQSDTLQKIVQLMSENCVLGERAFVGPPCLMNQPC